MVAFSNSPFITDAGYFKEQPIAFSHQTHVGDVGLDCQFCHASVDKSSSAGMPSPETCYGCHREILSNSKFMAPIKEAIDQKKSIPWAKVNSLADHVYFHHGQHIKSGVSCKSCHGDVEHMPLMATEQRFSMEFCLNCHRTQGPELQGCYTCHR